MKEPFNEYMANPMQSVPISIINTECSPSLPIIQFKKCAQTIIMAATKFHDLTIIKLHCKKCKNEGMYEIMREMMKQYETNNFCEMNDSMTIHEIMKKLIPLKSQSKIYWLRLKVNLTTCQIGVHETFNGIIMEALIAKRARTTRTKNSSKKSGMKYFLKLFVHASNIREITEEKEIMIYKLGYDFSQEITRRYNIELATWQFGFYYINKTEYKDTKFKQWNYNGHIQNVTVELYRDYIDYKRETKPLDSIERYLESEKNYLDLNNNKFYHGSWRYKNALTEMIANETYLKARKIFIEKPNYWHVEESANRLKGFGIMRYYWRSKHSVVAHDLSNAEETRARKVAGGLRYFLNNPQHRIIPSFIKSLIPCIVAIGAWDKQVEIGQVAANIYHNPPEASKPAYAFLDPHNERDKFTHLTAIYINSSAAIKTGCAINLKSNVGNGVVLVNTDHLDIIKWHS